MEWRLSPKIYGQSRFARTFSFRCDVVAFASNDFASLNSAMGDDAEMDVFKMRKLQWVPMIAAALDDRFTGFRIKGFVQF